MMSDIEGGIPVRIALLINGSDHQGSALHHSLPKCLREMKVGGGASLDSPEGQDLQAQITVCHSLAQLYRARPDLAVVRDFGALTLQAVTYRLFHRRTRLLLWLTGLPTIGPVGSVLLRQIDGVLAPHFLAPAIATHGVPAARIFQEAMPREANAVIQPSPYRTATDINRLLYVGKLTPEAGVADFLHGVIAWAELNPTRPTEIRWVGEGDLRGVLEAQPLPPNLSQHFLGRLPLDAITATFADGGALVAPTMRETDRHVLAEAMAFGLPIIASVSDRMVRQFIREGKDGWLFDPHRPDSILHALDLAFAPPLDALDQMRAEVSATVTDRVARRSTERMSGTAPAALSHAMIANSGAVSVP